MSDRTNPNPIRDLRRSLSLTQAAFSHRFGIPLRTVENWESAVSTPPCYVIDLLKFAAEHGYKK